jgi:hypothetical protein
MQCDQRPGIRPERVDFRPKLENRFSALPPSPFLVGIVALKDGVAVAVEAERNAMSDDHDAQHAEIAERISASSWK